MATGDTRVERFLGVSLKKQAWNNPPPAGEIYVIQDSDGTLKQYTSDGTKSALGGGVATVDPWDFEIPVIGTPLPYIDLPVTASDSRYSSIDFEAMMLWDPLIASANYGIALFFNGDTTLANYLYEMNRTQETAGPTTTAQGGSLNDIAIVTRTLGSAVTCTKITGNLQLAPSGAGAARRGCVFTTHNWDVSRSDRGHGSVTWLDTASDVTFVRFMSDTGTINIFGSGSYLKYRLVG